MFLSLITRKSGRGSLLRVPGKPRRQELDFVRGIAILMVMAAHFIKPSTGIWLIDAPGRLLATIGGHGVDLFFVLSGYLVGGLLIKEYRDTGGIEGRRFLIRRAFKIWPAYYFLIFFHAISRHHPLGGFFWQNVFHVQNYLGSTITQTWTLSIEEHFYFLLTVLLVFVAARKWAPDQILKLCVAISILAVAARCVTAGVGNLEGALRWTQNRIDSLLFGVILALLYYTMPAAYSRITARAWPLIALSMTGFLFMVFAGERFLMRGPGYTVLYIAGGAFLLLVNTYSGRATDWWIYRVVSWIGVYSYGLYLWHSVMLGAGLKIAARYQGIVAWTLALGVQFVGAIVIAYVTTRLIEWPFLRWRDSIPALRDTKVGSSRDQSRVLPALEMNVTRDGDFHAPELGELST